MAKESLGVRTNFKQRIRAVAEALHQHLTDVHESCLKIAFGDELNDFDRIVLAEIKKQAPPEALARKEVSDCCFVCSREKCEASSCVSRYGTIEVVEKKGLCQTCDPCSNFTSKPAESKGDDKP